MNPQILFDPCDSIHPWVVLIHKSDTNSWRQYARVTRRRFARQIRRELVVNAMHKLDNYRTAFLYQTTRNA